MREVRLKYGTTISTSFTAADNAAWNADAAGVVKLRTTIFENSLGQEGIVDPTMKERRDANPPNIAGLQNGTLKIGGMLGGSPADTSECHIARVLAQVFGGYRAPINTKTITCEASCTTTNIKLTSAATYVDEGDALLFGSRGDGGGDGCVGVVKTVNTDDFDLYMALPAAPALNDTAVVGHMVYYDESATQSYFDVTALGRHAEDQIQLIGAMGPPSFENLVPGQLAQFAIDLTPIEWQEVASGDRASLSASITPDGTDSPASKGFSIFCFGDESSTTRATIPASNISIDPGVTYEPVPGCSYANNIGEFRRMTGRPVAKFSVPIENDDGAHADFTSQTKKQLLLQFGRAAQGTVAFWMGACYHDNKPMRAALNNISGLEYTVHGEEPTVASSPVEYFSTPMAIFWF